MKRLTILLLIATSLSFGAKASEPVYLICTSQTLPASEDLEYGVRRIEHSSGGLHLSPPIGFNVLNESLRLRVVFRYCDYDFEELAKVRTVREDDHYEKLVKPVAFLDTITPIDVNEKLATLTKASSVAWIDELRNKKVYLIDRSEIGPDSVIIRQVRGYYPMGF